MIGRIPNAAAVHSLETRRTAMCLLRAAAPVTFRQSPPRAGFVVSAPSSVLAPLLHTEHNGLTATRAPEMRAVGHAGRVTTAVPVAMACVHERAYGRPAAHGVHVIARQPIGKRLK